MVLTGVPVVVSLLSLDTWGGWDSAMHRFGVLGGGADASLHIFTSTGGVEWAAVGDHLVARSLASVLGACR